MKKLIGLFLLVSCGHAFIVPQELPSILSLVYSNIPPIKKGTDSRVGFGYRLGEHADFQVLFELGPQTNTRPIGAAAGDADESDTSKRNVNQADYGKSPNPVGTQWLNSWSNEMKKQTVKKQFSDKEPIMHQQSFNSQLSQPIKMMPFIEESALRQLQQLYKLKSQIPNSVGTLPAESMEATIIRTVNAMPPEPQRTNKEKAKITADLMDVNLDDDDF